MKFFKNRFLAAFVIAFIAVLLVLFTPHKKESTASSGILGAAVQAGEAIVTQMIQEAISDMANNMMNTVLGDFLPFTQDLWTRFAQEQRLADIENQKQMNAIQDAEIAQDMANQEEQIALEEMKDAKISDGECQVVTASYLSSAGHSDVEAYKEAFSQLLTDDLTAAPGSLTEKGPVVANRRLLEFRLANTCSTTEYNNNLGSLCSNPDEANVDKDVRADLLTECHTFPKEEAPYVAQMIRYLLVDVQAARPMSNADLNDPDQQENYLRQVQNRAQNSTMVEYVKNLAAERMEPSDSCPEVGGTSRLDFVNEIDRELGRTDRITADRPCPSQAEFDCYRLKYQFQSPQFVPKCDEGEAQMDRCVMLVNSAQTEIKMQSLAVDQVRALMNHSEASRVQ